MNIAGKQVLLRAIEADDHALLHQWANNPEIQLMIGGWHFPSSLVDQQQWAAGLSCNSLNQRFAITAPDVGLIGTANLVSIDWKNRSAFHGILLGDKAIRGKGFGLDAVMAIMRYAFDELGLVRLDGDVIEYNEASQRLYVDKCGWLAEGRKANAYFRKGRFWDKVILGITRERYQEFVAANGYWR